jgi:putative flippase GtrA
MTTKSMPLTFLQQRFTGREGRRFARFLVVGAIGFVVDFGVLNIAHAWGFGAWVAAHFLPFLTPYPAIIEQTLSLSLAIISNFLWNYFWIYPEARQANQGDKMIRFVIVSVAGLAVGVPIFSVALITWQAVLAVAHLDTIGLNLAANLALMTRVGVLLFWNYFVNRYWTYKEVPL